jgi:Lipocalin-like domain
MSAKHKTLIAVLVTAAVIGSATMLARPALFDNASPVGSWKLVSLISEDIRTKERTTAFGEHPNGYLVITPEGRLITLVTAEGRKAPQTSADRDAAFRSEVAYSGKFHMDGDRLVTKVDTAWNESWVGTEQVRIIKVEGNRLYADTAPTPNANVDGKMIRAIAVWEREK